MYGKEGLDAVRQPLEIVLSAMKKNIKLGKKRESDRFGGGLF